MNWLTNVPQFGQYDMYENPAELFWLDVDNGFDVFGKQDSAAITEHTVGLRHQQDTHVRVIHTAPVNGGPA